jgi:hypothetical protein
VLIVGLALSAPVGEALVSAVGSDVFGTRNLAVSLPAFALVAATLLVATPLPFRVVPVALVLAGFGIAAVKMAQPSYQRPPAREAAEFINREAAPGDTVIDAIGLSPGPLIALDLSLDRPLKAFRLGQPQERDHPFRLGDPILSPALVVGRATAAADGRRIFLVTPTAGRPHQPTTLGAAAVRSLPARYRLVEAQSYPGFVNRERERSEQHDDEAGVRSSDAELQRSRVVPQEDSVGDQSEPRHDRVGQHPTGRSPDRVAEHRREQQEGGDRSE